MELEQQLAAAQAAAAEQQRKSAADAAAAVEQFQAQCEEIKTAATAAGLEAGGENPTPPPLPGCLSKAGVTHLTESWQQTPTTKRHCRSVTVDFQDLCSRMPS